MTVPHDSLKLNLFLFVYHANFRQDLQGYNLKGFTKNTPSNLKKTVKMITYQPLSFNFQTFTFNLS